MTTRVRSFFKGPKKTLYGSMKEHVNEIASVEWIEIHKEQTIQLREYAKRQLLITRALTLR